MHQIFLWFYCLPISGVIMLIAMTTAAFWYLRVKFAYTWRWKVGIPILFICSIGVILLGTLGQRVADGNAAAPILIPFHSYYLAFTSGNEEVYRTNFMNVVLFYPAGLLGCELLPQRWRKIYKVLPLTIIFALLSISIEYTQYHFGLGLTETDDVIHNTLGTLLGALVCDIHATRIKPAQHQSK